MRITDFFENNLDKQTRLWYNINSRAFAPVALGRRLPAVDLDATAVTSCHRSTKKMKCEAVMITITEKDGATIIVIENPSGSEQRVIDKAKAAQRVLSDDVWSKFACNQKPKTNSEKG